MATEREVIREFLVSLGFQVDAVGARKFASTLQGLTKFGGQAATAIASVAVAAEAMVQTFSHGMERLYYASKRTKSSVENLQALEFGAKQIGLNIDDARGAIENFARSLRLNPGLRALLDNILGRKSEGVDNTKNMRDLVEKLSAMPHYVGAQFAQLFGMDEKTFFQMKTFFDELTKAEERRIEMNRRAGISADEAAAASRKYMNALRSLWEQVEVLGQSLSIRLLPYFQKFMEYAGELLDDLLRLSKDGFDPQRLGEWGGELRDIVTSLKQMKDIFAWALQSDIAQNLFGALGLQLKAMGHSLLNYIGAVAAFMSGDWKGALSKVKKAVRLNLLGAYALDDDDTGAGRTATEASEPKKEGTWLQRFGQWTGADKRTPLGLRQNNPGNLRRWAGAGVRNGFAAFGTPEEGLSAMAQQLLLYSRRGLNTIKDIITKYAPPSENDTAGYIGAVSKRMGVDPAAVLDLNNAGTLSKLMDAMIRQEQGFNPYGGAELGAAAAGRIGARGGVSLQQQTNITVHGASNADALADRIRREQDRVNGDLVRNMSGAVQ